MKGRGGRSQRERVKGRVDGGEIEKRRRGERWTEEVGKRQDEENKGREQGDKNTQTTVH